MCALVTSARAPPDMAKTFVQFDQRRLFQGQLTMPTFDSRGRTKRSLGTRLFADPERWFVNGGCIRRGRAETTMLIAPETKPAFLPAAGSPVPRHETGNRKLGGKRAIVSGCLFTSLIRPFMGKTLPLYGWKNSTMTMSGTG